MKTKCGSSRLLELQYTCYYLGSSLVIIADLVPRITIGLNYEL